MMRALRIILSVLAGAIGMYILDPRDGARRRALMRDQMIKLRHNAEDTADTLSEQARDRAVGTAAEIRSRLQEDHVDDNTLKDRVRAEIGRNIVHAGAIDITTFNGHVTLRGPVLRSELATLLASARGVRGVKAVENRLDIYESASNIPDLQGKGRPDES